MTNLTIRIIKVESSGNKPTFVTSYICLAKKKKGK